MSLKKTALATIIALSLTACGSSGGGSSSPTKPSNGIKDNQSTEAAKAVTEKAKADKTAAEKIAKEEAEKKANELRKEQEAIQKSREAISTERAKAEQAAKAAEIAKQKAESALMAEQKAKKQADDLAKQFANEKAEAEKALTQLSKEKAEAEKNAKATETAKADALAKAQQEQQAKQVAEQNLARLAKEKAAADEQAKRLEAERIQAEQAASQAQSAKDDIAKRIANEQKAKQEAENTVTRLAEEKAEAEKEAARLKAERKAADLLTQQRIEEAKALQKQQASQAAIDRLKGIDSRAYNDGLNVSPFLEDNTINVDGFDIITRKSGKDYIYNQKYSVVTGRLTEEDIKENIHQFSEPTFYVDSVSYGIKGLVTTNLPKEGRATYTGQAFNADNIGSLTYHVDFTNKVGGGVIENLGNIDNLNLKQGNITKKGIESSISSINNDYISGNYNLQFFGQNAEEIAGQGYIYGTNLIKSYGGNEAYLGFGGTRGEIQK